MLHKESHIVSAETFLLIQQLEALPELNDFSLVRGTALALQLGHRNSLDIDSFSQIDFDYVLLTDFNKKIFIQGNFCKKEYNHRIYQQNKS